MPLDIYFWGRPLKFDFCSRAEKNPALSGAPKNDKFGHCGERPKLDPCLPISCHFPSSLLEENTDKNLGKRGRFGLCVMRV